MDIGAIHCGTGVKSVRAGTEALVPVGCAACRVGIRCPAASWRVPADPYACQLTSPVLL